jgi:hypothetical protein
MQQRAEQTRVNQLVSSYAPDEPPRLPLDFGDYLSLLWQIDRNAERPNRVRYYRQCAVALSSALNLQGRSVFRLVETTKPGELYAQLPNAPYRGTAHLIDAADRKAAIAQLTKLRADVLRIGTYHDQWVMSWPGSGIIDGELRERVFAVLFTALQGQFSSFGRLLLVLDIVLADLLLGGGANQEIEFALLVRDYRYPNPDDERLHQEFYAEETKPKKPIS